MAYAPFQVQRDAHRALLVEKFRRAMLYWSRRTGKCLCLDTEILTPNGPVKVQNIQVGDAVYGYEHGEIVASTVTAVMDNGVQDTYKLSTRSQTWRATRNHRWLKVGDATAGPLKPGKHKLVRSEVSIPCGTTRVPHAYAIGALIGDGCSSGQAIYEISSQDEAVVARTAEVLNCTYKKRLSNNFSWGINAPRQRAKGGTWLPAATVPEYAWLRGFKAHQKRLPFDAVDTWDRQSCLELLAGLIDTDGSIGVYDGQLRIGFGQQSKEVSESYRRLVYKLWQHHVALSEDKRTRYKNGSVWNVVTNSNHYTKRMLKELHPYLQCDRKKYKPEYDALGEAIADDSITVTVSEDLPQQTFDITVSNPSHLYLLAGEGLVTHNTKWSVEQLKMSCMLNQGPHHIIFKEYQQAETVAWNQYIPLIEKSLIKEVNKSTLTVTFNYFEGTVKLPIIGEVQLKPDFSKPPASIRLLGSDKADSHRGLESYGMIFDEYQDQDHYGWDFVYSKFLYTTKGWAVFMGTAKDSDEWNDMLERAELSHELAKQKLERKERLLPDDWYYRKALWRENPNVDPDEVEADRRQQEAEGKLGAFLQETELIPFTQQGAVYPDYARKIHHVDAEKIPQLGTDYVFLDFGFAEGHPMAACFVRITREDVWYQWDEIFGTGIHIDDLIAEIRTKMADRRLTGIIADSARPDLIEYMASKGMPVIPAPKGQKSVLSGIQLFSRRLKPKIQLIGEPKPNYFIDTVACPNTHYQFKHYRYKEVKQHRHPDENPEKFHDDAMDALRYGELFFKYGHPKDEKLPKNSTLAHTNSYGLL